MSGRGQYRPMPDDFQEHANERYRDLMDRYQTGTQQIARWKQLCGAYNRYHRAVIGVDPDGNERRFDNLREAARFCWGYKSHICHSIHHGTAAYGRHWRYEDDS